MARPALARVVLAAAISALVAGSLVLRAPAPACGDICSYYSAGLLAREGPPEAVYEPATLERRHLAVHDLGQRAGPFLYSPLWILPSELLAAEPLPQAIATQRWAGALALAVGLFAVLLALESLVVQLAVAGSFALSHAAWVQLIYGNWSFLLFAFLAIAALAIKGKSRGAGILAAALALHLKPFVLFALAPASWARRRLAIGVALVTVLLAAAVLPVTRFSAWERFASFLAERGVAGVTPFYSKSSLAANIARLTTEPREWVLEVRPVETFPVRAAFWLGLPLFVWGAARLRERPSEAFAFGIAWTLLFVPQVWEHTEILLFATLPALARRYQWGLAAALAATVLYNGAQQRLLLKALAGASDPFAVKMLLWLYPAIAFFVLLAALDSAAKRTAPESDVREPAG